VVLLYESHLREKVHKNALTYTYPIPRYCKSESMLECKVLSSKTCRLGERCGWHVISFRGRGFPVMKSTSRLYLARLLERRTQPRSQKTSHGRDWLGLPIRRAWCQALIVLSFRYPAGCIISPNLFSSNMKVETIARMLSRTRKSGITYWISEFFSTAVRTVVMGD
jgi:hypothetical protein